MRIFVAETRPGRIFQVVASVIILVAAIDYVGVIDLTSIPVYLFLAGSARLGQDIIEARLTDEHRITESDG